MFKKTNVFLVLFLLASFYGDPAVAQTTPTVSWYYRGSTAANGTSLSINSGCTFILGCFATAYNDFAQIAAFVVSKTSPLSTYTTTAGTSGTKAYALTVSGGTVLYDSVNGNKAGYDYVIVNPYITIPVGAATMPVSGYLNMYIPLLSTSDAGTYYCSFIDGSALTSTTTTSFGSSGSYTLTITTQSGSGSQSVASSRNRALEYSLVLLGASKILF